MHILFSVSIGCFITFFWWMLDESFGRALGINGGINYSQLFFASSCGAGIALILKDHQT